MAGITEEQGNSHGAKGVPRSARKGEARRRHERGVRIVTGAIIAEDQAKRHGASANLSGWRGTDWRQPLRGCQDRRPSSPKHRTNRPRLIMKQSQVSNAGSPPPSQHWMRAVSFAGLHRILNAVGDTPNGLRAKEINELVLERGVTLTTRNPHPKPTTLYHYRNTLLRLQALIRDGRRLRANSDNPGVSRLLRLPAPANGDQSLGDVAREHFAELVLNNDQCRALFFDLFMPSGENCASVSDFRENSAPVSWTRKTSSGATEVLFENEITGRPVRHTSSGSLPAILYGLRYWARDELKLIDEYGRGIEGRVVMFPVFHRRTSTLDHDSSVVQAVRFLLDQRNAGEWTLFSISDLIVDYCQAYRQPRTLLFDAIDWLRREWPHHTVLIPTSRALATIAAASPQQEILELRRYYKSPRGPYISHLRLHEDVAIETEDATRRHVRYAQEARA